uniref:PBAN-type neuropeptides n=1 Tax=Helicoverpa assulta TaxID=52344 RepID=PBAN_HELAU|nr:RecName: Full=PBAN-type neuropeptides; AltName: Full=Pheromone/pyrokinin biosynthesis-activating neuropeptide; Contains: RecName: Full=Diapause hormone homolog; Short=DH; AltName: Full=Pyrokinin-1; Contains: RecName: Full=Alpha-SG neuropeptide; Contains: RecName: Full=Beta-SG neuropeptide; AltName: Full=Pyrokinin-2; Contains: RecName: Full=Pheromone biosynthesis-activating neuropeptide; Short=Has-PBAN; Short=HeA-PBAN; AltName: Full=Pyrokinin-3; Contains: RecName: Full=Gamma-SG neuropeptide; AltN
MFNQTQFFVLLAVFTTSSVLGNNNDVKDGAASGAHSDRLGLWFGPRLGKRSLRISTEDNRQAFFKLLEAADALKYYYDQLPYEMQADEPETRVTKKVIFTPKLGRSLAYDDKSFENVEFTPRLGRRLSDDMPATPADQEMYRQDPEQIDSRTKYFSPRLGRTMNFSPRLGRELSYDMMPNKIRVVRSANKTRST